MNKFLAVVKREYVQKVRTKFFVIMTILGPFMLALFTVVPGLLLNIKTGENAAGDHRPDGQRQIVSIGPRRITGRETRRDTNRAESDNSANSNAKSRSRRRANHEVSLAR